jgi:hypothetical protein
LRTLIARIPKVVTVEDHTIVGGFGSAILEFLAEEPIAGVQVKRLGVPDRFIEHGTQEELRKICGFDQEPIARAALQMVTGTNRKKRWGGKSSARVDVSCESVLEDGDFVCGNGVTALSK